MLSHQPIHGLVRQDRDDPTVVHILVEPQRYLSPEVGIYLFEKLQVEQYLHRPIYFEVLRALEQLLNEIIAEAQMSDVLRWDYVRECWGLHAS